MFYPEFEKVVSMFNLIEDLYWAEQHIEQLQRDNTNLQNQLVEADKELLELERQISALEHECYKLESELERLSEHAD